MKIKLYKGAAHGKTYNLPDDMVARGLMVPNHKGYNPWLKDMGDTMMPVGKEYYEIVMMRVTIDGQTYTAPAMHPDGSVFMVKKG